MKRRKHWSPVVVEIRLSTRTSKNANQSKHNRKFGLSLSIRRGATVGALLGSSVHTAAKSQQKTLLPNHVLLLSRRLNRVNEITFSPYKAVSMTATNQDPIFRNACGVSRHFAALLLSFLISKPFAWSQPAVSTNAKPNI